LKTQKSRGPVDYSNASKEEKNWIAGLFYISLTFSRESAGGGGKERERVGFVIVSWGEEKRERGGEPTPAGANCIYARSERQRDRETIWPTRL
jgi:hypothetical protein